MNILTKLKQIDELERGATPDWYSEDYRDSGDWRSTGLIWGDAQPGHPGKHICTMNQRGMHSEMPKESLNKFESTIELIIQTRNAYPEMSAFIKGAVKIIGQIKWANNDSLQQQAKDFLKKYGLTEKGDE